MNTTRWVLALAVLVLVVVAGYVALPAVGRSAEQTAVRDTVTNFGLKLQNVSLSASSTAFAASLDENYAAYVTPTLLLSWKDHPSDALGRATSSPWPDRIEVASVTKNDDGSYHVEGTVVELTSVQKTDGSNAPVATYPVHMTVSKVGTTWLITQLEKGSYSELPQLTTMEGVYGCVPLKVGTAPNCTPGLTRTESDAHFVLDLSLLPEETANSLRAGNKIEIVGTLVPIAMISSDHWQIYDIDGIIQVKELKKL